MSGKYFDLVGTIHGREYSDHGQYVTADDYYHLQLHGEAVSRLKLGLEQDLEKLQAENEELKHKISAGSAREWDLRSQLSAAKESRARAVQLSKSLRKDADRYRWLRRATPESNRIAMEENDESMDLAIDAAIRSREVTQ